MIEEGDKKILIDPGNFTFEKYSVNDFPTLDGVLITHPHFDHYGGLKYLLKEFPVGTVFDNGNRNVPAYEEIFRGLNVRRSVLAEGDRVAGLENVQIRVLHPPSGLSEDPETPLNEQSIVLQVQTGEVRFLLAGDAESGALGEINRCGGLQSDVLKVPHHGSGEKDEGQDFISLVKPKIAIISEAERNRFNLPSAETLDLLRRAGARTYQTGLSGAVEVVTDGKTVTVAAFREE